MTGPCQGDTGGPLAIQDNSYYTLLGLVPYNQGCYPTVYSSVQAHLTWIYKLPNANEIKQTDCASYYPATNTITTTAIPSLSGTVQSPKYPNKYPDNVDETYLIEVPAGKLVEVTFTRFDVEAHPSCDYDHVSAVDAGDRATLLGASCGTTIPGPFTSNTNKVNITFHSDYALTKKGFSLTWKAVNPKNASTPSESSMILSPNYPKNYPDDKDMEWDISVAAGKRIRFVFDEFEVEPSVDCKWDYVEVGVKWRPLTLSSKIMFNLIFFSRSEMGMESP